MEVVAGVVILWWVVLKMTKLLYVADGTAQHRSK
jgi:hypothetical protein